MKMLFGFGTYGAFRGSSEHHNLKTENIFKSSYPDDYEEPSLAGVKYMGLATMGNREKNNKITVYNNYSRDTKEIFRFPILDGEDSFGASLERYMKKLQPGSTKFYNVVAKQAHIDNMKLSGFPEVRYYKSKVLGVNKIAALFKEGAVLLGLSNPAGFRPHSLRGVCITRMVNSEDVSLAETMRYARHTSVSASKIYQRTDGISEANRMRAIGLLPKKSAIVPVQETIIPRTPINPYAKKILLDEEEDYVDLQKDSDDDVEECISTVTGTFSSGKTPETDEPITCLGILTQVAISELEENIQDLQEQMDKEDDDVSRGSLVKGNSSNCQIVHNLIGQVQDLRKQLKKKEQEGNKYHTEVFDRNEDFDQYQRDLWALKSENRRLKRENDELFNFVSRSEARGRNYGCLKKKKF